MEVSFSKTKYERAVMGILLLINGVIMLILGMAVDCTNNFDDTSNEPYGGYGSSGYNPSSAEERNQNNGNAKRYRQECESREIKTTDKRKGNYKMAELNIVLVEPEIPQNTGNIARTCAATGARLHIVKPMGFTPTDRQLKRAGLDYWKYLDLTYYENLGDFFKRTKGGKYYYFSTKAPRKYTDIQYPENCYLVFGKESKGLPEILLHDNPNTTVRIPMSGEIRSLNLSNSAAIAVYEVLRQWNFPELQNYGRLREFDWDNYDPDLRIS